MTRLNLFTLSLILFSMALFTTPTPGHAANKQIDAIGVVDCGQDTCTVVPLKKGSGQPLLYFVVRSAQGSKILKQAQACSFARPLQMTIIVDDNENIIDVLKITCAKK